MRAVAAAISGAYALAMMALHSFLLPSNAVECADGNCVANPLEPQILPPGMTTVALAVPTLLVLVLLVAVLGARATRDPEAGAVLAALGQTRGTSVRIAARHGLRDGAIATGAAYVVAGAIHVGLLVGNPATTGAALWLGRATIAVTVTVALTLAHVLTAARRPRAPVEALTADMQDEAPPRPSLRRRAMLTGGALGLASGVIVALALWKSDDPTRDISYYVTNTAGIAMIVAWVSALALGLWVMVPWLRARRDAVIGAAAAAVGRDRRVGAVLATYAGDRSRASARIVTVLAALGFLIASVPAQESPSNLDSQRLGTIVMYGDPDTVALERAFLDVEGIDGVISTEAALVSSDAARQWVFAVRPDDLRGRDDAVADALERYPNAVAAGLWNGVASTELVTSSQFEAEEIVPIRGWVDAFVNAQHVELASPGHGFIIFATADADLEAASVAVDRISSNAPGVRSMDISLIGTVHETPAWNVALNLALAALVLGLPLTMLAVGAVRRRRRDDTTLTALGASARTMRAATAIEAAVVSAFALAAGMAVGAATRVVMTALQQGRLSLGPVIVDSPIATGLQSVAWGAMGVVGVSSVAIMTVAAFITASVTGRHVGGPTTVGRSARARNKEGVR